MATLPLPERFIRCREISERIGISYKTLQNLRCQHRLEFPLEKRCGVLGLPESKLNEYIRTGRIP